MKLKSLCFSEHAGGRMHWSFDRLNLGDTNLIVGMNASGKTRTLNVINGFASLLGGRRKQVFVSGDYVATFTDAEKPRECIKYCANVVDSEVLKEELRIGRRLLLTRGKTGKGRLQAEKLGRKIDFKVPTDQLAVVAKRDSLQHPFLEKLHDWGDSVKLFRCSTKMGKDVMLSVGEAPSIKGQFSQDTNNALTTFLSGCNRWGNRKFKTPVKQGMRKLGYSLRNITVEPPTSLTVTMSVGKAVCLHAHEFDLKCSTDQNSMSDGMFRALALLIQVNYSLLDNSSCCLLIDDIGEGLDYERSNSLVDVIRQKTLDTPSQLLMASNDRFVMNTVPLREWQVVERDGQNVRFYNHENSREAFEEFEMTGLANFDFFRSGFFAEEVLSHE